MTVSGLLQSLESRLRQISLRERRLLYAAALLTPFLLILQFAVTPVENEQARLDAAIDQQRTETRALQQQIQGFASAADPLSALEARQREAENRIEQHEAEFQLASRELLSPRETASLLRALLDNRSDLELQRLVRRSPETLDQGEESRIRLQNHRIEMEWTGPYLDTLAYLEHLEAIPVTWLWGSLDLVVETHPTARVQLTLDAIGITGIGAAE